MAGLVFNRFPEMKTREEVTNEKNARWINDRAAEWVSYPTFLSPIWGIIAVLVFGWVIFIILLVLSTYIWRRYILKVDINLQFLATLALIVKLLQWPLAIIMAIVAFISQLGFLAIIAFLIFPLITYLLKYLELPYEYLGKDKQQNLQAQIQERIIQKLGIAPIPTTDTNT